MESFYTVKLKTYNCIVFTDFQHTKLYPFQNLSVGFIFKIFLNFRKFHPRYSYKKRVFLIIVYISRCVGISQVRLKVSIRQG